MQYHDFYRLNLDPFLGAPQTRFYFQNEGHERVLGRLFDAVDGMRGLVLCTGTPGLGKTLLARRLYATLTERHVATALLMIVSPSVSPVWLLRRLALQLGIAAPAENDLDLMNQLYRRLLEGHRDGQKAALLIDEAQMLASREIMETFRSLLNLELPGRKLLNIVLFGLPEIERNLRLDDALAQRVAVRCRLRAFDETALSAYLAHRLELAGGEAELFSPEAVAAMWRWTEGVPRLINTLADNLLYEGALREQPQIDAALVESVAAELFTPAPAPETPAAPRPLSALSDTEALAAIDRLLEEEAGEK